MHTSLLVVPASVRRWDVFIIVAFLFNSAILLTGAPVSAYWQQRVAYRIDVRLIDSNHTIEGDLDLTYTNNSPDTLRELYFHLYNNAFQPGSMMQVRSAELGRGISDKIMGYDEVEQGRYWIDRIAIGGTPQRFDIFGTVMKVTLGRPMAPGTRLDLAMTFREQIPKQTRRNGWRNAEGIEYSMAQWYPKIAAYDHEGWQIQEYIAREFYGEWGSFDVTLRLPSQYVVAATGHCQNPNEVGRGYDQIARGVLTGLAPSTKLDTGIIAWRFKAENVHDFAWTADPDYIHEWRTWRDSITIHAFYQPNVAKLWTHALEYTQHALQTFSDLYGDYPYRNFSNTQSGDGGMEYPQLIMITGFRGEASLAGVTAHEVGHEWFYGLLGSNESREAFMDEGFTDYATTQAIDRLWGFSHVPTGTERSWLDWFIPPYDSRRDDNRGYASLAAAGYEEPLTIPHDWFREDVNAGQVYGKTKAVLDMLEYTLGDSVFARGMKMYFDKWKFKHPHLVDFRRVMEEASGTDLDWFFDEWFSTTRTLDYAVCDVSSDRAADGFQTTVRLWNNDVGVMPIDLTLYYADGTSGSATIPLATNKGNGYRKPEAGRIFFPDWDWVATSYVGCVRTDKVVSYVRIDTSGRLQDLNRINDRSHTFFGSFPPFRFFGAEAAVWKQLDLYPPLDDYWFVFRPLLWYDQITKVSGGVGAKLGFNLIGKGDIKLLYRSYPDARTGVAKWLENIPLDLRITGSRDVDWLGRLTTFSFDVGREDGFATTEFGVTKVIRPTYLSLGPTNSVRFALQYLAWLNSAFPVVHSAWESKETGLMKLGYHLTSAARTLDLDLAIENGIGGQVFNFSTARLNLSHRVDLGSGFLYRGRFVVGASMGELPAEREFHIGRANAAEEMRSDFWRALTPMNRSFFNDAFLAGGAGVRALASSAEQGGSVAGASLELNLPLIPSSLPQFFQSFSFAIFADAGWVGSPAARLADLKRDGHYDLGLSLNVNILNWLPWQLRGVASQYATIPQIGLHLPLMVDGAWGVQAGRGFSLSLGATF